MKAKSAKKTICVITGSRAEFGLLRWLMSYIKADPDLELQILVTGSHLSVRHGETYKQIEEAGFSISKKVPMLLDRDDALSVAKSVGQGVIFISEALDEMQPDLVVVLGDRFEILAAAQSAMLLGFPVAHIHGGEITEGALDDSIRHCITKMASLHFVSTEAFRNRVIQLGERPETVYNVGAPGLDGIDQLKLLSRYELEQQLDFQLGDDYIVVTYHPETLGEINVASDFQQILSALESTRLRLVFTQSNADTGGQIINELIEDFVARHKQRSACFKTLGQLRYFSLIKHSKLVLGNSSSGLIEVPSLGCPTVNVGARQRGRLKGASVIDCAPQTQDICRAIERALDPEFRSLVSIERSPYGVPGASKKIFEVLKSVCIPRFSPKKFWDLKWENSK
jgi:UDP-hydrolysing UDP-N-acetyl-D-glucosamine 2-epimerase